MKRLSILFLLLWSSLTVCAQSSRRFEIRKTYDGSSRDENKPASLSYNRDFKDNLNFYIADLGVKFTDIELLPHAPVILRMIPKLEYHADKRDTFKLHNTAVGLNFEFQPASNNTPRLIFSTDYQGDFVKETQVWKTKAFLSFYSTKGLQPCSNIRNSNNEHVFRWFPYLGFERFQDTKENAGRYASFFAARVYLELLPFPDVNQAVVWLLITTDFSYRWELKDEIFDNGDVYWSTTSVNYYPTGNQIFGIGVDYSVGFDPVSNFTRMNKLTLSVKVKL